MSFETKSGSILNLFLDTEVEQYKIPKYQRAYSWTEEEVITFCEDLNEVCESNIDDYFFGAVIMIKDSKDKKTRNIIDGQQRITTFTILMSKLKNLCEQILQRIASDEEFSVMYEIKDDIDNKKAILSQCLEYNDSEGNKRYKLELSDTDKVFFEEYLKISRKKEILGALRVAIRNIEIKYNKYSNLDEIQDYTKKISETKDLMKNISTLIEKTKNINLEDLLNVSKDGLSGSEQEEIKEKIILSYLNKLEKEQIDVEKELRESKFTKGYYSNISLLRSFESKNMKNEPISHKRIMEAGKMIEKKIINPILDLEDLEEQVKELMEIIDSFTKKTYIVTIISSNEDTAYTMFQVLNDRGRSLGVVDLLRPHTLQMLESYGEKSNYFKEATKNWDNIAEKADCDKYMSVYLESYIKVSQNDKKIHNRYKKLFFDKKEDAVTIRNRIRDIEDKYEVYDNLNRGEWPYIDSNVDSWTKNRLREIVNKLKYKRCIPLLMAIYDECSEEDFVYALEIIDRVVFRYITICSKRPTKLTNVYESTIKYIRENKSFDREIFKENMKSLFEEDGASVIDFREKIKNGSLNYVPSRRDKILYFLTTIESYYVNDYLNYKILKNPNKTVVSNGKNIDIEHIYPQNALKSCKDENMDKIVNNLGNLTIIEDIKNKKLGNKPFEDKKKIYINEKLTITNIISKYKKWHEKEIEERENMYLDIAERIFTLD